MQIVVDFWIFIPSSRAYDDNDNNDSDDTGFPCSTVHVCMVEAELMMTRKITVISLVKQAFKSTFFSSRDQCRTL